MSVTSFQDQLQRCGVDGSTLATSEQADLRDRGFVVFDRLLSDGELSRLRTIVEEAFAESGAGAQAASSGTRHVGELLGRDDAFIPVFAHPRILAATVEVVARPFRLFGVSARDPAPGYGAQGLHADWVARVPGDPFGVVTWLVLLDAFTATNGATRLVPGSHRSPGPPPRKLQSPGATHAEEIVIEAEAGSVLLFNGHLWHAGTRNDSKGRRRVLQCQYLARDWTPPTAEPVTLPPGLSEEARELVA